jgi:hypothetical protein
LNQFITNEINFDISTVSDDFCRLFFIINCISSTSSWTTAAISIDRLMNVKYPAKFIVHNKKWFQVLVCFALLIKDFLVYSQLYFEPLVKDYEYPYSSDSLNSTNETVTISKYCAFPTYFDTLILIWVDFINAIFIPFFIMITCTLIIVKVLFQSRRSISDNNNQEERRKRDRRFAINAISINIIFFLTALPLTIFNFYFFYFSLDYQMYFTSFISNTFYALYYLNFGSSFYINFWVNYIFREEFLNLIRCNRSRISGAD